jgi:hypothetical protein
MKPIRVHAYTEERNGVKPSLQDIDIFKRVNDLWFTPRRHHKHEETQSICVYYQ